MAGVPRLFTPLISPEALMALQGGQKYSPVQLMDEGVPPADESNWWDGIAQSFANYGKTWADPSFGQNYPFRRSDDQTGFQNTMAGLGNSTLNLPSNMWHLYQHYVGQPFATNVSQPAITAAGDWFTKSENQKAAEAQAAAPPPAAKFTPGLPQGQAPDETTSKIIQTESGGKATAKNPNSSAFGPGQFIKSTWLEFMRETAPEVLANLGEKKALELRSDPAMAEQATSWYAGKAVDTLDSINAPATETNIYLHHFLGPGGVKKLLTADPNALASDVLDAGQVAANKSVLGGARTVQDVIDWAGTKMGDSVGLRPTPAPHQVMPDFSAAQNWFDQAAPQGVDPQLLKNEQFAQLLAGIGQGLGSVDASRQGGGALFGALAQGTTAGVEAGQKLALQFDNQLKQDKAAYAGARAGFEQDKATLQASIDNANAQGDWMGENDQRAYDTAQSQLEFSKAEKEAADARLAASPKIVEANASGLWIQQPDGGLQFLSSDTTSEWDQIEKLGQAFGQDSTQVRSAKYNHLAMSGNLMMVEMEIAKDLLKDGLGASIWGEAYTEAYNEAEKMLPGGLGAADPEAKNEAVMKSLAGLLLGASQQSGNYDWIQQAAAMGNPGAMMLVQNGTLAEAGK